MPCLLLGKLRVCSLQARVEGPTSCYKLAAAASIFRGRLAGLLNERQGAARS